MTGLVSLRPVRDLNRQEARRMRQEHEDRRALDSQIGGLMCVVAVVHASIQLMCLCDVSMCFHVIKVPVECVYVVGLSTETCYFYHFCDFYEKVFFLRKRASCCLRT